MPFEFLDLKLGGGGKNTLKFFRTHQFKNIRVLGVFYVKSKHQIIEIGYLLGIRKYVIKPCNHG